MTFQKQSTYTPRLLLVDLKGSLGYLSEAGSLYASQPEEKLPVLWDDENIEITKEPEAPKTPFIQSLDEPSTSEPVNFELENDVKRWVDYLVPRFHPRTVNVIKEYSQESESQPFDIFNYGRNLWNTESFSDDFTDKIRSYVEECDLIQGFQVFTFFIHY